MVVLVWKFHGIIVIQTLILFSKGASGMDVWTCLYKAGIFIYNGPITVNVCKPTKVKSSQSSKPSFGLDLVMHQFHFLLSNRHHQVRDHMKSNRFDTYWTRRTHQGSVFP